MNSGNQATLAVIVVHAGTETMLPKAVEKVEKLRVFRLTMGLLRTNNVVMQAVLDEARVALGRP